MWISVTMLMSSPRRLIASLPLIIYRSLSWPVRRLGQLRIFASSRLTEPYVRWLHNLAQSSTRRERTSTKKVLVHMLLYGRPLSPSLFILLGFGWMSLGVSKILSVPWCCQYFSYELCTLHCLRCVHGVFFVYAVAFFLTHSRFKVIFSAWMTT